MDKILRCITTDGSIMASAVDTTEIVSIAQGLHNTSAVATAALGRLLTASSLIGAQLKQKDATVTLRINGGGPLGAVVAVADSRGNCRGYVSEPAVELPLNGKGKLDVGSAVGHDGILNVMRDYGSGEPYIGQVPIVSGEIAEDITEYYAKSEQIPTVCALGVLTDKEDHSVLLAGGLLIQLLPGAGNEEIDKLEESLDKLDPMTTMLAKGMDAEAICRTALEGFEVEVLDEWPVNYVCSCSKEKVKNAMRQLSAEELISIIEEDGGADVHCHFCNKDYLLERKELEEILKSKKSRE